MIDGPWKAPALVGQDPAMAAVLASLSSYSWQLPWGNVVKGSTGKNDGTSAAIGTTDTALWAITFDAVKGRRYYFNAEVSYFSAAGASNFYLYLTNNAGTRVLEADAPTPSTTFARTGFIVNFEYDATVTRSETWTLRGQFAGAAGTVLYNQQRWIRFTCEDAGPFPAP